MSRCESYEMLKRVTPGGEPETLIESNILTIVMRYCVHRV